MNQDNKAYEEREITGHGWYVAEMEVGRTVGRQWHKFLKL